MDGGGRQKHGRTDGAQLATASRWGKMVGRRLLLAIPLHPIPRSNCYQAQGVKAAGQLGFVRWVWSRDGAVAPLTCRRRCVDRPAAMVRPAAPPALPTLCPLPPTARAVRSCIHRNTGRQWGVSVHVGTPDGPLPVLPPPLPPPPGHNKNSTAAGLLCRLTGFRDALCLHRCVVYFVHDPRILVRLGRA